MFEIRSYHYDPDQFAAYKQWAINHAVPFLKANMDVVGFWMDDGTEPELAGSDPVPIKHGVANVTWIIRWSSKQDRDDSFKRVFASDGWQAVFAEHPDADGYLQTEVRFADEY